MGLQATGAGPVRARGRSSRSASASPPCEVVGPSQLGRLRCGRPAVGSILGVRSDIFGGSGWRRYLGAGRAVRTGSAEVRVGSGGAVRAVAQTKRPRIPVRVPRPGEPV